MTDSKASHSISSEINPRGGKPEPRNDRRYGGKGRERGREQHTQTNAGRLGRPVSL